MSAIDPTLPIWYQELGGSQETKDDGPYQELGGVSGLETKDSVRGMDGAGPWNFAEAIRTHDVKQDMTDS
jgi:hypothetical protein